MRHTVHLLLGDALKPVTTALNDYVQEYGEGEVKDYLQIISWEKKRSDDDTSRFFSKLYTETLTINREGESHVMHLCIEVLLHDDALVSEALRIIRLLDQLSHQYKVDVLGLTADMTPVFGIVEGPGFVSQVKANTQRLINCRTTLVHPEVMHRFFMMQNCNTDGVSLCLDQEAFIRIAGELAMACTENYDTLFPLSEETEATDLTAFGLSVLSFDKHYFTRYLMRRAFLKLLDRERVTDKAVDINRATSIAQESLKGKTNLLAEFYAKEILPLLRQGKRVDAIASMVAEKLNVMIENLINELQTFVYSKDYSLPEKQAILAQLLSIDDPLITGYQFNENALTLDDCSLEPLRFFVDEINRLLTNTRYVSSDFQQLFEGNSDLPHEKGKKQLRIPIDEMKQLRESVNQTHTYLREKQKEMADIERQQKLMGDRRASDGTLAYEVIRKQVEEEKKELKRKTDKYAKLRTTYENMVQTLGKPAVRKMLQKGADARMKQYIEDQQTYYDELMQQRSETLDAHDKETWENIIKYAVGDLVVGGLLLFMLFKGIILGQLTYYIVSGVVFYTLSLIFYPAYRKNQRNRLEAEMEEEMAAVLQDQTDTANKLKTNALRTHIAGMLLDAFAQLNKGLTNRYLAFKTYLGRLSDWHQEETEILEKMESESRDPFLLLISNQALDEYFEDHCEELIDDLWLYESIDTSDCSPEALKTFREKIEEKIKERLMSAVEDFNLYDYITRSKDFPYLSHQYSDVSKLLPLLDSKSKPFLHYAVKDIRRKLPMQRYIFIHTNTAEEQSKWRETYPSFFQIRPNAAETDSRFKLVVIQKQDIRKEDVAEL